MAQNTALLVLDMQSSVLQMLPNATTLLDNVTKAIAYARSKNIPVIYSVLGFRPGFPEISPNNAGFLSFKETLAEVDLTEWVKIHDAVAPQENDIVVAKRRASAFSGNDLEIILRANNINELMLTGFATRGVILSTAKEAADKDYKVIVLSDCCADTEPDIHQILIEKVFVWGAEIKTVEQWTQNK